MSNLKATSHWGFGGLNCGSNELMWDERGMMFDRLTELCDLARTIGWQAADILRQAETNFDVEK